MTFRFLHTADWHIGKPFGRFDEELAPQLRQARLNAIDRIAAHAIADKIDHVLVAGDIFDQADPSNRDVAAVLERLATRASLTWWILPGNHDPASPHGVWWRIGQSTSRPVPDTVKLLLKPEPVEIEQGVFLLPSPLHSHDPGYDATAWMDACETPAHALRIGLAHGATHGFGEDRDDAQASAASVISPTRAETARLDYFALGDWHGQKQIAARVWYSGTPEPDRFRHNEPGGCLAVTLAGPGEPVTAKRLETSEYAWRKLHAAVHSIDDVEQVFASLGDASQRAQKTLVQLTLTGELPVADVHRLQALESQHAETLAYLDLRNNHLLTRVTDGDLDSLDHGGMLRAAGEDLVRQSNDLALTQPQRDAAQRALQLLFTFAAQSGRERVP